MLASVLGNLGAGRSIPPDRKARGMVIAFGIVVLLSTLSALGAGYPLAAAFGLWDLAVAFGLLAAAASARAGGGELPILAAAVIGSSSLQAIVALLRRPWGVLASGASFLNPNHLAAFLNFGCILCADRAVGALTGGRRRAGLLWSGLAILNLTSVMSLMSRGAVLALLVSLAILLASHAGG